MGPKENPSISPREECPVCGCDGARPFFRVSGVPVFCNVLWPTREEALACPRGKIELASCTSCGYIWNRSFRPDLVEYSEDYDNSLHFSGTFQSYARSLAERLVSRYGLRGRRVIEVGCGKGEFLRMLCNIGGCEGTGFDPSYGGDGEAAGTNGGHVSFVKGRYDRRYVDHPPDLIVCQQTLEHVPDPKVFLAELRRTIGGGNAALFVEVPNSRFIFGKPSPWDVIYEHPSYFFGSSLRRVFSSSAFRVTGVAEAFGGQYLWVDAEPGRPGPDSAGAKVSGIEEMLDSFAAAYHGRVRALREELHLWRERGETAVVWGAGAKGVALLNALGGDGIRYAVDINPRKQGRYVPGTGQRIVPPEFLRRLQPDAILVMNRMYDGEVRQAAGELGFEGRFLYP